MTDRYLRNPIIEGVLVAALIVLGASSRIVFREIPNFAPVAAIALFAGYFLTRTWLAVCVPLAIMGLSDSLIGTYDWRVMVLVYSMLALPVSLRSVMRRWFSFDSGDSNSGLATRAAAPLAGLLGCSLFSSVLFYLVTNFGSWLWFDMYERSWPGLLECYASALPFFRYTLAGDLLFGLLLFGGYGIFAWSYEKSPKSATAASEKLS